MMDTMSLEPLQRPTLSMLDRYFAGDASPDENEMVRTALAYGLDIEAHLRDAGTYAIDARPIVDAKTWNAILFRMQEYEIAQRPAANSRSRQRRGLARLRGRGRLAVRTVRHLLRRMSAESRDDAPSKA